MEPDLQIPRNYSAPNNKICRNGNWKFLSFLEHQKLLAIHSTLQTEEYLLIEKLLIFIYWYHTVPYWHKQQRLPINIFFIFPSLVYRAN